MTACTNRLGPGPRDGTRLPAAGPALGRSGPMAGGLVAVSLWGLAPVATRAVVTQLAPMPLLVLRLTVAALVLLPWAVPVFRRLRPRSLGRLLAAGALGLVGYNLPVTVGLQWLPAATAGLLLATEPVWVMIVARAFLGARAGARAWLGSAVALGGVALLAGPAALTGAGGPLALAGAGLVLAGTLAFGAYTIVLRPLSQAYGAVPATAASTVVGAVPYLAFAGTLSAPKLAYLPGPAWGELAFLALGSTVAGMLLWDWAVLAGGVTRVSLLLYLEPAVSMVGAVALLGEHPAPTVFAGGALILAGVAVSSIQRSCGGRGPGNIDAVSYDPTIYRGSAAHYRHGRPAYSPKLEEVLVREAGLDGSGRLLDVGCGPGVLTVRLAHLFGQATGLDPDAAMLGEGRRAAEEKGIMNIRWVRGLAEDLPAVAPGPYKLVTFGQSFHWTDEQRVAETVFDMLEPGGALALVVHTVTGRPRPPDPGVPAIPHDEIKALVEKYLGSTRRAGQGISPQRTHRFEDVLARTRFGVPRQFFAPGLPGLLLHVILGAAPVR